MIHTFIPAGFVLNSFKDSAVRVTGDQEKMAMYGG